MAEVDEDLVEEEEKEILAYTHEEWQQPTAAQKQQVRDQRAEKNKHRNIEVLGTGDTKRSK